MADTRKAIATLQSDWADNSSGSITAQLGRDAIVTNHPTNIVQTAAFASIPGSGQIIGDLFYPSDGNGVYRWSGSAWVPWGPVFPFTDPTLQSWSWFNQGAASVVTTFGGIHLLGVNDAAEAIHGRVKSVPTAPYTVTAAFLPRLIGTSHPNCGIFLTDGTKATIFGWYTSASLPVVYNRRYDNATTFNANGIFAAVDVSGSRSPVIFFRIIDDNTKRKLSYSSDGQNWLQLGSETRTTFLTPTQIGFYCNSHTTMPAAPAMTLLSWKEE